MTAIEASHMVSVLPLVTVSAMMDSKDSTVNPVVPKERGVRTAVNPVSVVYMDHVTLRMATVSAA